MYVNVQGRKSFDFRPDDLELERQYEIVKLGQGRKPSQTLMGRCPDSKLESERLVELEARGGSQDGGDKTQGIGFLSPCLSGSTWFRLSSWTQAEAGVRRIATSRLVGEAWRFSTSRLSIFVPFAICFVPSQAYVRRQTVNGQPPGVSAPDFSKFSENKQVGNANSRFSAEHLSSRARTAAS